LQPPNAIVKPQLHMIPQKSRPSAKLCPKSSVALKKVVNIMTSNEAAHVFSLFCARCWRSGKKCRFERCMSGADSRHLATK
jgi:hypothetical protein